MSYQSDLQACYSQQARQFDHSRKRKRPEVEQILTDLNLPNSPTIVDLGCGSGRLFPILREYFGDMEFTYIGVDSASGMIDYAREQYPDAQRICMSMQDYVTQCEQQSIDGIICLASMQHISGASHHEAFLRNCYRALRPDGQAFFVNWSWSEWFLKKYWKQALTAGFKSLITKFGRNDLFIPRKDPQRRENGRVHMRMYHVFGLNEITTLCKLTYFDVVKSGYIMQNGSLGDDWRRARNTYIRCGK